MNQINNPSLLWRGGKKFPIKLNQNGNLHRAKAAKNDEFYTQFADIERELLHYTGHFKDKVVFCNCDNPEWSNFWKFFSQKFDELGLKKLISTHYETDKPTYKLELTAAGLVQTQLTGNGDFRSDECVGLLNECDIVVTNPPFSLFREFVVALVEAEKQFLILGNNNAITYKDTFKLIKENKLWLGSTSNKTMEFQLADTYAKWDRIDPITGNKFGNVPAISWFTNMDHSRRHDYIQLSRKYDPATYPAYDNYDAIEVGKVADIPVGYAGVMGVPITFMGKFNPDQFEICGTQRWFYDESLGITGGKTIINGRETYDRIFIKNKSTQDAPLIEAVSDLPKMNQIRKPALLWRGGKKFAIKTKSRELDQFYTQPGVAQNCMDYLATVVSLTDSDFYLEPSAGKGAFYDLAPSSRRVGLDLDPQHADVMKQDYLTYNAAKLKASGKLIVIGNPPFGKNASLAIKFFNKSAEFADCIAFILPRTFKKVSLRPKLDKQFQLIGELDLPWDSFEYDGKSYSVPCVFQVWQKSATERVDAKPVLTHSDFKFVTSTDSADFAVRRIGALAGKVIVDYEGYAASSHYYIKSNKPVADTLNAFANMDWDSVRFDTAGNPSVSKAELVALYAQSTKLN